MEASSFCSLSRRPPAKTEACYLKELGSWPLLFQKVLSVPHANEPRSMSAEKEILKA